MKSHKYGENGARDARAAAGGKPSFLERVRRAFAPKMAVWLITPAGRDDEVLYAAHTKKAAFLAAHALVFRHFFPHYSAWLPLHGHGDPDGGDMRGYGIESDAWREYLEANVDEASAYLSTLEVRRALYDRRAFAAMVRVMCGAAPLGLSFETDEEIECWLSAAEAAIAEGKEGEKAEEKPSAPLDKKKRAGHNGGGKKKGAGAKRGAGRPAKKGGPAEKAPGAKKGDSNGNQENK